MIKKPSFKKINFGTWQTIADEKITEIICDYPINWITFDLEHTSNSFQEIEKLIRIANLKDVYSFVRIPKIDPSIIQKVLDAGSNGIICPNIKNLEQIKQIHSYMHYPPQGIRGVGLSRAQFFGKNFKKYFNYQKSNLSLIVQIEDIATIEKIDSILKSKLIDGFIIGPYDLSCSMGIPGKFNNIKYKKAVKKLLEAAIAYKVPAGIHVINPEKYEVNQRIKEGFKIIGYGLDFTMIKNALEGLFKK